jgi:hypothetical protein
MNAAEATNHQMLDMFVRLNNLTTYRIAHVRFSGHLGQADFCKACNPGGRSPRGI